MTTGSQNDIFERLKDNLVPWFGTDTPNLDGLLKGAAYTDSKIYELIQYIDKQTRIKTATGDNLDLISLDYFGNNLPRHFEETDTSFRNRILTNLLAERATRRGMITILKNLTGRDPTVIEGFTSWTAGFLDQNCFYDVPYYPGMGWLKPYTAIIYAYRPLREGFTTIGGFDGNAQVVPYGGFGFDMYFNNSYIALSQENVFVTDQDIINTIEQTKQFGTYMYVSIFD